MKDKHGNRVRKGSCVLVVTPPRFEGWVRGICTHGMAKGRAIVDDGPRKPDGSYNKCRLVEAKHLVRVIVNRKESKHVG